MKPYPFTSSRFDIDRYLEQNKTAPPAAPTGTVYYGNGCYSAIHDPKKIAEIYRRHSDMAPRDAYPARRPIRIAPDSHPSTVSYTFRPWAVRLNDWIERRIESINWKRFDELATKAGAVTLTGFVLYMLYQVADAWLQGRFNLGGN